MQITQKQQQEQDIVLCSTRLPQAGPDITAMTEGVAGKNLASVTDTEHEQLIILQHTWYSKVTGTCSIEAKGNLCSAVPPTQLGKGAHKPHLACCLKSWDLVPASYCPYCVLPCTLIGSHSCITSVQQPWFFLWQTFTPGALGLPSSEALPLLSWVLDVWALFILTLLVLLLFSVILGRFVVHHHFCPTS